MSDKSKPTILAIDTSTDVCSVALYDKGEIIESTVVAAREHTQRILPMVESILAESKCALVDIDALAVANGPGSFTGLRIGLSIAQGLAYGISKPLIPVSTLEAMAHAVIRHQGASQNQIIVPAIDARMDEIYWSAYRLDINNSMHCVEKESVSVPMACYQYSHSENTDNIIPIGSGWRYYSDTYLDQYAKEHPEKYAKNQLSGNKCKPDIAFHATAYDIAALAVQAFVNGKTINPINASPTYLRNEITWQKRQRIRN